MLFKIFLAAFAASPLVAAHGRVNVITGDAGGNGTALAIQGAVVPGPGPNRKTEVDTTVFGSTKIATDGLGKTTGQGKNNVAMIDQAMALSGDTLPQVSDGGSISGTFHVVTTDGAGPVEAVVDPTGTGAFSQGIKLTTTTQVPGKNGNIAAPKQRSLLMRALVSVGIVKRAANVNEDFPVAFSFPSGINCQGTAGNVTNMCLVKIANSNPAGPFGGVVPIQIVGGSSSGSSSSSNGTTAAASSTSEVQGKNAQKFSA